MNKNKPKLTILGQGAIGLLFASYLRRWFRIQLLVRSKHNSHANIVCHQLNGEQARFAIDLVTHQEVEFIDQILIPIKAYQVESAIAEIKPKLTKHATVIFSHNGMPNLTLLNNTLPTQQLFFLTTSMAALKLATLEVKHTGLGPSFLGPLNQASGDNGITKRLLNALPNSEKKSDILLLLWQKLLINIAINPLTGVFQVKNGALVAPEFAHDILGLLNEAVFIAKQEGIAITLAEALNSAYLVMRATSENYSSMNRDIFYKRTTEIESICGYIIKKGAEYQYSTPYNQKYLSLIQGDKP